MPGFFFDFFTGAFAGFKGLCGVLSAPFIAASKRSLASFSEYWSLFFSGSIMLKTPAPKEFYDTRQLPSQAMLAAIGRVALISASIEDFLHSIHWKYSGLTKEKGPIVTCELRPNRLAEDTLKLAKAAKARQPIIDDLTEVIEDYKASAPQRNELVHWIWEAKGRNYAVIPPSYKSGREPKHYSLKVVEQLGDDLLWIEARLSSHALSDAEILAERAHFQEHAEILVPAPWLDKPEPPNPTPSETRDLQK